MARVPKMYPDEKEGGASPWDLKFVKLTYAARFAKLGNDQ